MLNEVVFLQLIRYFFISVMILSLIEAFEDLEFFLRLFDLELFVLKTD